MSDELLKKVRSQKWTSDYQEGAAELKRLSELASARCSANEGYPPTWARVVLMVSPTGELHAIGGDVPCPIGDAVYTGLDRIKRYWKYNSPNEKGQR